MKKTIWGLKRKKEILKDKKLDIAVFVLIIPTKNRDPIDYFFLLKGGK